MRGLTARLARGAGRPPLHPPLGRALLRPSPPHQGDVALLGTVDQTSAVWTRAQGALLPETPASGLRLPDTHRAARRRARTYRLDRLVDLEC